MSGKVMREMDCLMRSPLRWQHNTPYLLDLGIVSGGNSIQISSNLGPQVGDHDKLLEDVLREDVGVSGLLDVI